METMARELNMDVFQITKSTKFGSVYSSYGINDPLEPSGQYVSGTHRFEREQISLTNKSSTQHPINFMLYNQVKNNHGVVPLCEIGNKGLYIDAQGRLFPCCWVANRYSHNSEWKAIATKFDLRRRTLADAVTDDFWGTTFKTFEWQECQTKCATGRVDKKYATEW
jgi:hypothetical protein